MEQDLKQKTVTSLIWSFIDSFSGQGIQFVVGIILARLLTPKDFGLIGMLTIFIAISQSIIDSGFSQALIRKQKCTNEDYSTVFFFNFAISLILYTILFLGSDLIASYFEEPQLKILVKVIAISLVLNAIAIIQRTILAKELNFKLQTKVSVIASLLSGSIAIFCAYKGFGVWSLVVLAVGKIGIDSILLWYWSKWRPIFIFSKSSFFELFSFGSRLLLSGLINTTFKNIYLLVIGKYFSSMDLGFYTRADQFKSITSVNLQGIISRVTYPVLSVLQDDDEKLKLGYKKVLRLTMLITFVSILGMASVAKSMIVTLIGEKWLPSVVLLQLLCFSGMFYPLHALNLGIIKVKGRSDLYLRLEIIKKIFVIPVVIIGVQHGIKVLIIGMIVNQFINFYLNSYWSSKLTNYKMIDQIKDIIPSFVFGAVVSGIVYSIGILFDNILIQLLFIIQVLSGAILVVFLGEMTKFADYLYLKGLIVNKLRKS